MSDVRARQNPPKSKRQGGLLHKFVEHVNGHLLLQEIRQEFNETLPPFIILAGESRGGVRKAAEELIFYLFP